MACKRLTVMALLMGLGMGCKKAPVASAPVIALLLPESKTARYESQDLPWFRKRLEALGHPADAFIYANAGQDAAAQRNQAEAALTNGARVLVLDPVDSVAAGAVADLAGRAGVPVVAYDRLIRNSTHVTAYLSFDNQRVGRLQAESLLEALKGKDKATVVMINGSPTDNNAALLKTGAHQVLDGKVQVVKEYDTPDWSPDRAQDQMQQALTALGNKVDGVYAANDGTAGGAIAAMKAAGLMPLPPVTGQDAELAGVQRVLAGEQYMTIYKALAREAQVAAELAHALATTGKLPKGMMTSEIHNGAVNVPALLLDPVAVTRANVKETVLKDGFWTTAQLCTAEFAAACKATGIVTVP